MKKVFLALARGVKIQVYMMDSMKIQYAYMEDLIRMLGILIDNAIEASEQIPSGYVAIEIAKTDQAISFSVKNNYLQEPGFYENGEGTIYNERERKRKWVVLGRKNHRKA